MSSAEQPKIPPEVQQLIDECAHLKKEYELDLSPLTNKEWERVLQLHASSHPIFMVKDHEQNFLVLKKYNPQDLLENPVESARRELEALQLLTTVNTVATPSPFQDNVLTSSKGQPIVLMTYLDQFRPFSMGFDARKILDEIENPQKGQLSDMIEALGHLHQAGIVHKDFHLGNVGYCKKNRLGIVDFESAVIATGDQKRLQRGAGNDIMYLARSVQLMIQNRLGIPVLNSEALSQGFETITQEFYPTKHLIPSALKGLSRLNVSFI